MNFLSYRSKEIFPNIVVQVKKANFQNALAPHVLFQEKYIPADPLNNPAERRNSKILKHQGHDTRVKDITFNSGDLLDSCTFHAP